MRWLLLIAVALQVANCGQSGPLRLPENTLTDRPGPLSSGALSSAGLLRVTPF
jgi:predicted small lipoprotein YifL